MTSSEWADALDRFHTHLDGTGRKDGTTSSYLARVRRVADGIGVGPWALTAEVLSEWLSEQNWSLHTRRSVLVALRVFYAWAIICGRVERSPLAGIPDGVPKRPGPLMVRPSDKWQAPVREYLITLQAGGRSAGTLASRRQWLTNLSHTFADPWQVTSQDLARYLSNPDWASAYRRSGRASIRLFYKWAVLSGYLDRDPAVTLASIRVPRDLPRPTPTDVVMSAFQVADRRTRLAIDLGIYAGLRISEVVQLKSSDIMSDRMLVHGKNSKQRMVPLHPDLQTALRAELSRRAEVGENSPYLFPSQNGGHVTARYLGRLVSDALGGNWTHHTLRHRFATQAYASTLDLRAVQELLGHEKPETTAIYAAVPDGALTAAVAGVGVL